MKLNKMFIATLLIVCAGSSNLFAEKNEASHRARLAAITHVIREQKSSGTREEETRLELIHFENSIPALLALDEQFSNPQHLEKFLDHFEFTINGEVIPVYTSKALAVRKDKPVTISIKVKPGKLESLLAFIKLSAQSVTTKVANLFTFSVSYDVPLHRDITEGNKVEMSELVYRHREMREMLKNPSNFMSIAKQYLKWPEWFRFDSKLPDLQIHDS